MNVLHFTRSMGQGGTEKVILQIIDATKSDIHNMYVMSSGGVNEFRLKRMHVKAVHCHDITTRNPFYMIKNLILLRNIIKKNNINIVHCHHRMAAFYMRVLSPLFPSVKVIFNAHNTFKDKSLLTKFSLKKCTIVAVGQRVKVNLEKQYGVPKEQIKVIYNKFHKIKKKNHKHKHFCCSWQEKSAV